MPEISHPLAHCEAAKAYYYAWADTCNEYPMGNKIREAAHVEYQKHIGGIKDKEKNCPICVEVLGGLHAKSKEMFQVKACTDGKAGQCKGCWEDAWGREGWEMSTVPHHASCYNCPFLAECRDNIWHETFDPYCFVGGKYHGLYVAEYQRRGVEA
jgi:hypothetical protein